MNYISVQQRRLELKGRMAELGTGLLADPEGNLASLKELQEMCADRDDSVAQLALLSSMAVFKDLLPGWVTYVIINLVVPSSYHLFEVEE